MKKPRRTVELNNFNIDEGKCSCGCGKAVAGELMLRLQALTTTLVNTTGADVHCLVTGGARCDKVQRSCYIKPGSRRDRQFKTPESFHMGENRIDEGTDSWAIDVKFYTVSDGKKSYYPREFIAKTAINSKLFGGVGYKKYEGDGSEFVHLDLGPVRSW